MTFYTFIWIRKLSSKSFKVFFLCIQNQFRYFVSDIFHIGTILVSSSPLEQIPIDFLFMLDGCFYVRIDPRWVLVTKLDYPFRNVGGECGVYRFSKNFSHFLWIKGIKPGVPIYSL